MTEANHGFTSYLRGDRAPALVADPRVQSALVTSTRQLVVPFLCNTDFWFGCVDMSFLTAVQVYTIWRRRDMGDVPYLLREVAADLQRDHVHRDTIGDEVEAAVRAFASRGAGLPKDPLPVIIEDCSEGHYLVLDGNKRLTGLVLGGRAQSTTLPVCIGHTWLPWWAILARLGMNVAR